MKDKTKNFEWRKLFPISWYRWNKGYDFNAVIFFVDLLLYVIPASILFAHLLISTMLIKYMMRYIGTTIRASTKYVSIRTVNRSIATPKIADGIIAPRRVLRNIKSTIPRMPHGIRKMYEKTFQNENF